MKEIEFLGGTPIEEAARMLVMAAFEEGDAQGIFNEIPLKASRGTSIEDIVGQYESACKTRSEEYENSPEGKAAVAEQNRRRQSLQSLHDALMKELQSTLDWRSDIAVLEWLCKMQETSDHIGVITRRNTIIETFIAHGFKIGVNTGNDYRPGNRDNMYRYLVGQALACLKDVGAIHGITHKFVDDFKDQFLKDRS
jgi:hypothetical protein